MSRPRRRLAALAAVAMVLAGPTTGVAGATSSTVAGSEPTAETAQPVAPAELELVEVEAATIEREANNARERVAYAAYVLVGLGVVMAVFTVLMWRATKPLPAALKGLAKFRPSRGR